MMTADYWYVAAFGALAGLAELLTRYRDSPWTAVFSRAGFVYLVVNALTGVAALAVVQLLDIRVGPTSNKTGAEPTTAQVAWGQVLLAGFSAVAFFRSALFTARVGDRDVPIGPSAVLKAILDTLDRSVDRRRAVARDQFLDRLPNGLTVDASFLRLLAAYCLGLMQNIPTDEQKALGQQVELIIADRTPPQLAKLRLVCLLLLAVAGEEVLEKVVARMKRDQEAAPSP